MKTSTKIFLLSILLFGNFFQALGVSSKAKAKNYGYRLKIFRVNPSCEKVILKEYNLPTKPGSRVFLKISDDGQVSINEDVSFVIENIVGSFQFCSDRKTGKWGLVADVETHNEVRAQIVLKRVSTEKVHTLKRNEEIRFFRGTNYLFSCSYKKAKEQKARDQDQDLVEAPYRGSSRAALGSDKIEKEEAETESHDRNIFEWAKGISETSGSVFTSEWSDKAKDQTKAFLDRHEGNKKLRDGYLTLKGLTPEGIENATFKELGNALWNLYLHGAIEDDRYLSMFFDICRFYNSMENFDKEQLNQGEKAARLILKNFLSGKLPAISYPDDDIEKKKPLDSTTSSSDSAEAFPH